MWDWISSYSQKEFDNVEIMCFYNKIYVPLTMCRHVLDWYHYDLKHHGDSRLAKNATGVLL